MSEDPEGPQCDGYDSVKNLRCTSTKTKLYQLPGRPVGHQKKWFCQPHGVANAPTGGGIWNEKTQKRDKVVNWDESDIIVTKVPGQSEVIIRPRERPAAEPETAPEVQSQAEPVSPLPGKSSKTQKG